MGRSLSMQVVAGVLLEGSEQDLFYELADSRGKDGDYFLEEYGEYYEFREYMVECAVVHFGHTLDEYKRCPSEISGANLIGIEGHDNRLAVIQENRRAWQVSTSEGRLNKKVEDVIGDIEIAYYGYTDDYPEYALIIPVDAGYDSTLAIEPGIGEGKVEEFEARFKEIIKICKLEGVFDPDNINAKLMVLASWG